MQDKKFVVCVDGVYIKSGKILLLKRSVEPFKGYWHLVGGHVKKNEAPRAMLLLLMTIAWEPKQPQTTKELNASFVRSAHKSCWF